MRTPILLVASLLGFVIAGFLLHQGFYTHSEISDLPEYRAIGRSIETGMWPYRDFAVEYPPAALPAFLLPEVLPPGGDDGYRYVFERLMWACGGVVLLGMALTLRGLDASHVRAGAALAFAALAPLALGTVYLLRFDLWPAALVALALAAVVGGHLRTGSVLLGLGTAAKVYPAALLPLAVAYAWRRAGRSEAIMCGAGFVVALAAVVAPFVVIAPDGVWASLVRQLERPLQLESLGAAGLMVAHHVAGFDVTVAKSAGSDNITGELSDALAALHGLVQVGTLAVLWVAFARGDATPERLVRYAAAATTAYVALGKVLSPQYLIWLVPLVPLVRGRRGAAASLILAVALVLTQFWFPFRYYDLRDLEDGFAIWLVLARDVGLLLLLAVLVVPLTRAHGPSEPTAR